MRLAHAPAAELPRWADRSAGSRPPQHAGDLRKPAGDIRRPRDARRDERDRETRRSPRPPAPRSPRSSSGRGSAASTAAPAATPVPASAETLGQCRSRPAAQVRQSPRDRTHGQFTLKNRAIRSHLRFRQTTFGQRLVQPQQCPAVSFASGLPRRSSADMPPRRKTKPRTFATAKSRDPTPPAPAIASRTRWANSSWTNTWLGRRSAAGQPVDQPGRFAVGRPSLPRSTATAATPPSAAVRASSTARRASCAAKAETASAPAGESRPSGRYASSCVSCTTSDGSSRAFNRSSSRHSTNCRSQGRCRANNPSNAACSPVRTRLSSSTVGSESGLISAIDNDVLAHLYLHGRPKRDRASRPNQKKFRFIRRSPSRQRPPICRQAVPRLSDSNTSAIRPADQAATLRCTAA